MFGCIEKFLKCEKPGLENRGCASELRETGQTGQYLRLTVASTADMYAEDTADLVEWENMMILCF